ncbi:MAG: ABC transporter permease [Hyphomicrobiaceae bacterium]|nr:ABC transporter permease [Hyphomicrobiaceae bacterium]
MSLSVPTPAGRRAWSLPALSYGRVSLWFGACAALCLVLANLAITALSPWDELARLLAGLMAPDLLSIELWSIVLTIAFATLGVSLGAAAGLVMSIAYSRSRAVRGTAIGLRAVHELFWALLLMQIFGIGPLAGILAIALPYSGIFAKVFAEMIEEADRSAERALPPNTSQVSAFAYARLPDLAARMKTYALYRLECGMRSTLVLGFIGLPTIGFHLETYFRQGHYGAAAALLLVFFALIGTRRIWARASTLPALIVISILVLPASTSGSSAVDNLVRFLSVEIVPEPLRRAGIHGIDAKLLATWDWFVPILQNQILPGIYNTLILSQIALVGMAILALATFPLVARRFAGLSGHFAGRLVLVAARSTPEYMLAYVLLQTLGPSMLPAIVALAFHNGAIVAYLLGRHADQIAYRPDAPTGLDLYAYDTLPRIYGQFLAYCLYRWEIIVRESAIFGILGVKTLGYYVDAAISELRFDRALVLILATIVLTLAIDGLSRAVRACLRISTLPTRLSDGQLATRGAV